jgi:alkylation response protein AidB-like acyl-CoA dehydrogenase
MKFSFTDDQRLFAESLRDLLDNECPPSAVRQSWDDHSGHLPALWGRLGEMGLLGLLVPESQGGMGGTLVDAVLLFQELGRAGVPGPVLEHMVVGAPVLAGIDRGVVDGSTVTTAWIDGGSYVPHAHVASMIVADGAYLSGHTCEDAHGVDGGRRIFTVTGERRETISTDIDHLRDAMSVASAAYLIGLGERMIDIAADYARQREQFGKPIGSFQAVKHLMSDALLKVEFAKAPTYRAAWSLSNNQSTAGRDASMAKALASEAAYRASRSSIQVHGGIGYTWEADLQLFMKKAWALGRAYGDPVWHRRRVAASVLA